MHTSSPRKSQGVRSAVRRTFQAASLSLLLTGQAVASEGLNFETTLKELSGPFKSVADDIARKARGVMGKGGEPQLLLDDYLIRNDKDAPIKIHRLANRGDAKARAVLGYMFDNGIGAERNHRKALEYFALAAHSQEIARYNLGVMTYYGRGTSPNPEKAMEYFMGVKRIAGAYVLMTLHAMDNGQGAIALKFAEMAHKLKDLYGSYLYARLLIESGNPDLGARIMAVAANGGLPEAVVSMIYINENGIGGPVNKGMAIGWWIINEVAYEGVDELDARNAARAFAESEGVLGVGIRFAARHLINYEHYQGGDYSKTLTYSDLERK